MVTSHSSISAHPNAQHDQLITLEVLKPHDGHAVGETIRVTKSQAKRLLTVAKDTFRIIS